MGCIDEPYLEATPNIGVFFDRWLLAGFTFGEAAYSCQPAVSWQTTVIGDPLYQPFGKDPRILNDTLVARHSPLVEWSQLRLVDLNLLAGSKRSDQARYLTEQGVTAGSAVLQEKLADLYQSMGQYELAMEACRRALQLNPSPQQKVRLTLSLADKLSDAAKTEELLTLYDRFIKETPDYPDALRLYQKLAALAIQLHKRSQAAAYDREIKKLTPQK